MDTVRYLTFPTEAGLITHPAIIIGQVRGYFADEGIDLTVRLPDRFGPGIVADGDAEFCIGHPWVGFREKVDGKLQAILLADENRPGHGFTALLARPELIDEQVLTDDPASVKGRTLGLLEGRGDDHLAYAGLLRQAGLTFDDVNVTPISHDGADRKEAFRTGTIDLAIGRSPAQRYAEQADGWARIWKVGHEVAPDQQTLVVFTRRDLLEERRKLVVRFASAYLRGARDYLDAVDHGRDLDSVLDALEGKVQESREVLRAMAHAGVHPDGTIDIERLNEDLRLLIEHGVLPTTASANDLVAPTIAVEAAAELDGLQPAQ